MGAQKAWAHPSSASEGQASTELSLSLVHGGSITDNFINMQDRETLDRYFTEQVVGESFVVEMGPSVGVRREPTRGLKLHLLEGQVELLGHAARGLVSPLQGDAGLGKPVSTLALARARRRLLVGSLLAILALWSALLWWVFQRFFAH
jgi:hypothetical protein